MHQFFGEKEQISGYEGLSIDITLSSKYLKPLIQITYTKKAPAFANIDDIEAKFTNHYGQIWTDAALYQKEVLDVEKMADQIGDEVSTIKLSDDREFQIRKVGLTS